jgi:dolichol-phosphate mannosyltransferase
MRTADGTAKVSRVAVVIPCYRVSDAIIDLLERLPDMVTRAYCVDDACPEHTGELVEARFADDPRIRVLRHDQNTGVGGAVVTGYRAALEDGADIVVKLDGDGQMDPAFIPTLIGPIVRGEADYVKGNRLHSPETAAEMPAVRLLGNAGLSLMTKFSTGYWSVVDPTNGFTAIDARVLSLLPLDKLHGRYFFESDMLFRLGLVRARVEDVTLVARYRDEKSNLSVVRTLLSFPLLHLRNLVKRIVYQHVVRGFSIATLELFLGLVLLPFGLTYGAVKWLDGLDTGVPTPAGTVMLAALPVILGTQLLLNFLAFDFASEPRDPIAGRVGRKRPSESDVSTR